jgi:hypothetical protein
MATVMNFSRDDSGNITIEQGKSVSWAYTLLDDQGAPLDITGYTARMHVRATFNSTPKLLTLTTENGKISNGGVTGQFTNTLLPEDTAYGIGTGVKVSGESLEAVYDYEVVNTNGDVLLIDKGTFTVNREVTREV